MVVPPPDDGGSDRRATAVPVRGCPLRGRLSPGAGSLGVDAPAVALPVSPLESRAWPRRPTTGRRRPRLRRLSPLGTPPAPPGVLPPDWPPAFAPPSEFPPPELPPPPPEG